MATLPKTLLFLDIETTGLKPGSQLLELAAILVRTHDLVEVSRFQGLAKCDYGPSVDRVWDAAVVDMHAKNGLLADIANIKTPDTVAPRDVLTAFKEWLQKLGMPAKSCYIAGSSVHTDIAKLREIDREVNRTFWNSFSHRILDVSTLRTFDLMVRSKCFPDQKPDGRHRAMSDCEQDLDQLRAARFRIKQLVDSFEIPF